MIRRTVAFLALLALLAFSALAWAQGLTPAQLTTIAAHINASTDPAVVAARAVRNDSALAAIYNADAAGPFVVWRKAVPTPSIGPVLNYVAVSNLTTANRDRATTFVVLNPASFDASQDIADYWDVTFGGTLGGQGATVRAALQAHWRRNARLVERIFATGTGTTGSPGALVYEGSITVDQISTALNP